MTTAVFPEHLTLLAPWPVPGVCDWLGGCAESAVDGRKCAGHGAYMRDLEASARKAWELAGVTL